MLKKDRQILSGTPDLATPALRKRSAAHVSGLSVAPQQGCSCPSTLCRETPRSIAYFVKSGYTLPRTIDSPANLAGHDAEKEIRAYLTMLNNQMKSPLRHQLTEELAKARRQLREQEQRLAHLNYEWSIAKRLRNQAHTEDEREKWRVQSDAYMGMVMQQEASIDEIREAVARRQSKLAELDNALTGDVEK